MKIAIVTKSMMNGGAERVICNLVSCWCKQDNIEISLVLLNDRQPIFYEIPEACHLNIISSAYKNIYVEKIDRFCKLRKIISQLKPDVVLSMPEEIGIFALLFLKGLKVPIVVSERNNPRVMPYKKSTRLLRKLMYPRAAGLIFQTKQAASFFSPKLQEKGIVLPNPLNLADLPDPYDGEREKIIVGAGRLEKQKNFPLLIEAFAEFYQAHKDYRLVIYGEGNQREALERLVLEKGLDGVITLPGRHKRLIEELRTKAMFVLSSDFEGMPNVVIEAMAVGTPVISTDCPSGGSAELIENGIDGFLVPVGDRKALCDAMCRLAEDSETVKKLGKNSVAIKEKLDCTVVAEQWRKYLEYVSNRKS